MTLHVENELSDYWFTLEATFIHSITIEIARDQFLELYIQVRLKGANTNTFYEKVLYIFSFIIL